MATMLMDKKRNPAAVVIVSKMRSGESESMHSYGDDYEGDMDHMKLAAYEFADAAGIDVPDIDKFLCAFKMLHRYCHEEMEEEEDEHGDNPGHMGGY